MTHDTIVLGAGMVGTSVAYHLARRGRSVALVDRQLPGQATSFGNAGIIQREAVQPHPFPRDIGTLMRVLPNRRIDIRYRPKGMAASAGPLWQYWRHSAPARYAAIVNEYATLIRHCTREHEVMIEASGAESLVCKTGWLEGFRSPPVFDEVLANARTLERCFGVTHEVLDQRALGNAEPHLADELIGAVHWTNAWTVRDPGALVQSYARAFAGLGGAIEHTEAQRLDPTANGWRLMTRDGRLEACDVVIAAGPWSLQWLEPLGYRLPLFPKRGYHMHYALRKGARLYHWLMDFESGYLLAPMQNGVRLTTGAELSTLDAPIRTGQLEAAEAVARRLAPLGERLDAEPWRGDRPCMPDMKPVIGSAPRHGGLWFALGHGHQGFTLGPVTGRLLGEMMSGEPTLVDMTPFRPERFGGAGR
ncbi:NAD(P)/FAD-dependent oxidoreductase [Aidingimonas halophila]|uniref:D-amino-acid dehydrogenase n=1 Tax=Aidingimonas halophila TaxID=574349 RepID=A0A1H2Y966_9GAMM|nr:FAD-dependent oxidoreductase [Aidingimonas halophila]GHC34676.1 D-amino-acid dehydrogenase [Aidingimonas halophila]SDX01696.1 D-amino-acid dehydrogenase [Aidingimonas halophila]